MAEEGQKLTDSIYHGSEDYVEFPCSPCSKEGRNVTALKHCVDCDENLCLSCLKDHNKFAAMRGHQMLNQMQSPNGARPKLPHQRCSRHGRKVIEVFCPDHDKVCCSTCIAVEHSSCRGISFIPDVVKSVGTSTEQQQFESKVANLKSRCSALSKKKNADKKVLEQNRTKLLMELRNFRKKINDHFDKMERKLEDDAAAKYKEKREIVENDQKEIHYVLENIKKTEERMQAAKQENESELFVLLKSESPSLDKISAIIEKMESAGSTKGLKFTAERMVEQVLDEECRLGEIDECYEHITPLFHGEYDVKLKTDKYECSIDGICICNEMLYVTDYNNKRVKKLDSNYKPTSYLSMLDNPVDVCNVDDKHLAVTLVNDKKVQFVSSTEPMRLQTSFSVGDRCRGIEYKAGLLFVCCGGGVAHQEGPGHVEVYRVNGKLMRSVYGTTGTPNTLNVSNDGKYIYLTYWDKPKLTILRTYGETVLQCNYDRLVTGGAICRLGTKLFCLTGRNSNNIVVITKDGHLQQTLISEKDGIKTPMAVYFEEKHTRIVVSTYESSIIKVFQLNPSKFA